MLLTLALAALFHAQTRPLIDEVIEPGSHPTPVVQGFKFTEGPVWLNDGHLIWSDILGDTIFELKGGKAIPYLKPSHRAIGNTLDPQGRLVSCHQETRNVTRREKNGSTTILASTYLGKRFNSPDDVVVRSDGTIFFTDPSFGLPASKKEQPLDGVYRISPEGKIDLVVKDFAKPNGLAFSPDEKLLYINDTVRQQIYVFDVSKPGDLSNERIFVYTTGELGGLPNGMKVDTAGNVYCTGPGGIQVFQPDGKYIGLIYMPQAVSNFCFGGADHKSLYITAGPGIYKIRVKIPGWVPFQK